jgi:hypothetical protein
MIAANKEVTEPRAPSGRHDLVYRYGVSVLEMTTNMFRLS